MGSMAHLQKPHAVCVPFPAQGHINPMVKLAKLLHGKGFHITFVNTEFNHKRLLKARGPNALDGLPSFKYETIPDGLPPSDVDATQDIPTLCDSTRKHCLAPFRELLSKLNDTAYSDVPPVSCIVSDGVMSFTIDAAEELAIPEAIFWTTSACGFLGYVHYHRLIDEGYTPLKDERSFTNGYLDTLIDWIPGMKNIRLRDLPSFLRTTNPDDIMLDFIEVECKRAQRASAVILNTFDMLEQDVLNALSTIFSSPVYSIGPLHLLLNQIQDNEVKTIGSNLWKEEYECLEWLDTKESNSVVYVNFGSITVMTKGQLVEFAWGLANSNKSFLWIIRPDIVGGDAAVLPQEFLTDTKDRGLLASWCPQEEVLNHPAIGGFLTHNGWNSTLESISAGVPMVCWPFFAEQQTNCKYSCTEWGVGMEINTDVKRDEVEGLVKELMDGEKGKEMKKKAQEWKKLAEEAVADNPCGTSYMNLALSSYNEKRMKLYQHSTMNLWENLQKRKVSDGSESSGANINASKGIPQSTPLMPRVVDIDDLPWDPADRLKILEYRVNQRDEIRKKYLLRGPCQPRGHDFPKKLIGNSLRRFNAAWFDQYGDWLKYSVKVDKAFCLHCYLFRDMENRARNDAFVSEVFSSRNKTLRLASHKGGVNSFHDKAVNRGDALLNQKQSIAVALHKQSENAKIEYRICLNASIDVSKALMHQGLAFRGHDEADDSSNRGNFLYFIGFCAKQNEAVGKVVLKNAPGNSQMVSPFIQKDIVHYFAQEVVRSIIDNIGSDVFSLLIDDCNDASDKEQMAVVLRYVDRNGGVKERLIGVVHVKETSSSHLKSAIDLVFAEYGLSLKNVKCQGYDGASNMLGEFNGLRALILNENNSAYNVHSFAHQL